MVKFLKIDKYGVWFDALFTNGSAEKPKSGKIILKLEDYSKLKYETINTEIEGDRLNDLIDRGVLKVYSLENY